MPDAVRQHTRNKRVVRGNHPLGQVHPAAAVARSLSLAQRLEEGAWHPLPRRRAVIAAHQHRLVLAVAVEQRQCPGRARDRPLNVSLGLGIGGELGGRLAKLCRFFEKVAVADHPVEQLRRLAIRPAGGAVVGRGHQHPGQAAGQAAVALEQLGQTRVYRTDDRRFAATKLHPLERERAARRKLHVHTMPDVIAHAMGVPFPVVPLAVEFLADHLVQRPGDLPVRIHRKKQICFSLVTIPQRVAVHAECARSEYPGEARAQAVTPGRAVFVELGDRSVGLAPKDRRAA